MKRHASLSETFPGLQRPTSDFGAVLTDLRTTPLYVDVDLSTARSISAAPRTSLTLPIAGNVLYIDQRPASGQATVHFQDDASSGNTPFTVFAGFLARLPFTLLTIENVAQPGLTLRIIYGVDLDFVPAVSPGSGAPVSVVDGGKARTQADIAFACFGGCGAVAANYSHAQLFNPAASPVNLIVEQVTVGAPAASGVYIGYGVTALSALHPNQPKSKYIDTSVAVGNAANRTQALGAATYQGIYFGSTLGANLPYLWAPREPVIVTPGCGLLVINNVLNTDISANFEFYEE